MSFTYGFYNGDDRLYDAVQISEMFDGLIKDGVYATIGNSMIVKKSNEANKVIVGSGRAWFNHTWNYNDSDMLLSGPLSDLFLNRWDAIVLDIHSSDDSRTNSIVWITGTPATTPQKPNMIKEPGHYQYPLAYIYRKTNTSQIKQEDITNAVGTSATPFVTGILDTLDIDNLLLQWNDQWTQFVLNYEQTATTWSTQQRAAFEAYVTEFENEMNAWLAEIQGELEEYPAASLQNQINELKAKIGTDAIASGIGETNIIAAINRIFYNIQYITYIDCGSENVGTGYNGITNAFKIMCNKIKQSNRFKGTGFVVHAKLADYVNSNFYYAIISTIGDSSNPYIIASGICWAMKKYGISDLNPFGMPVYITYDYTSQSMDSRWPLTSINSNIYTFKSMTQAQYNALTTKDGNTLYAITG